MTEARAVHVLVAGVTTRALAISAARAGYRVTAVDAFGDLDLRALVQVISVPGRLGARFVPFAAEAGAQVPAEMVAYTSNFENHPGAVARLAEGRRLLGNPPEVLARVRNPIELMRLLRRHGFARPESRATAPAKAGVGSWLLKPRRSGGGHGIAIWKAGAPVPKSSYLQERIVGHPGSVIFAADGRRAVLLGFSRQLVADTSFGAHGFRYCGSLLGTPLKPLFPRQTELLEGAKALATVLSREFQLVGLNGIDFIARKGVPYPIEVNPRYSASMELIERGQAVSMFEIHAAACLGVLPPVPRPGVMVEGKAIVFARHDVVLGDTRPWLSDAWLADVPHPGERIPRGRPICTVFARARDGEACRRLLIRRAAAVYRFVGSRRSRAA
jgi:predicted ATP-grasp superfamily ATP-dependent carboligase